MVDHEPHNGLLVLHGNRLELLAQAVLAWLAAHPLAPLEQETILVQSNGMAEWVKMALAQQHGICAATTVELPARFIWRAYRAVLGRSAVPALSPLDKGPLTWRLMHLLPALADDPVFSPVQGFLGAGDAGRRLQLAQRLADLFDQYQVYRADWLRDWSAGADHLRAGPAGQGTAQAQPLPADQRWQPALWRALLATLGADQRGSSRAELHQRFMDALHASVPRGGPAFRGLPQRLVLFGTTHIPHQMLEAIAALSRHCQVLLAVPNPCRFHWADLIDGREMLAIDRHRQPLRHGRDLSVLPLQDLHAHGHPLLAAWGRQCRDFVRQLDAFDDVHSAQQRFAMPRVDLFDEAPGTTLLQQVQAAIRDLLPLAEHPQQGASPADRSVVFHVAHSPQREVEILHDQLLHLLARPPEGQPLAPRDIVVMVPDIERFAPAIRSVFGQHPRWDARHIPWGIADQPERGRQPLLAALELLLRAPQERFSASQLRDLLDVPAVAARSGLDGEDQALLSQWIEGAGIRWGLNAAHRQDLGLGAAGEQNTWAFGLRRMLLGYATGETPGADGYAGIEPFPEVAGLQAGLAGTLDEWLRLLTTWWADARVPRNAGAWADRLRRLMDEVFKPTDDAERALLAALDSALSDWLDACELAGFEAALDLAVVREAWLGSVDEPRLSQRFKAGGVTFCTLLPLRAIPFEVVCLLGMNDGDYPRRGSRIDFDLMALPGQARPGDRSRRDDDRQLMLDALLSARRVLYVSWAGRSQRDNQPQPPSVLVAQLQDYLAAGWGPGVLAPRTTEHPLQPFSRRYFEPAGAGETAPLFTYAAEWRSAHTPGEGSEAGPEAPSPTPAGEVAPLTITLQDLAAFLRNPVKAFFRHRLQVSFADLAGADLDDEPFGSPGLERWAWSDEVLQACRRALELEPAPVVGDGRAPDAAAPVRSRQLVMQQVGRLQRAGRLPMAAPGRMAQAELMEVLVPMVQAWQDLRCSHPVPRAKLPLRLRHPNDDTLGLDDWLVALYASGPEAPPVWMDLRPGKLAVLAGKSKLVPRDDALLSAWVRCLAGAACGCPAEGILVGQGALLRVRPPAPDAARAQLLDLLQAVRAGLAGDEPLPTAVKTGVAWLQGPDAARAAFESRFGSPAPGEGREPCLARLFADFDALAAHPGFDEASRRLYGPYAEWLRTHVTVQALAAEVAGDGEPGALDD